MSEQDASEAVTTGSESYSMPPNVVRELHQARMRAPDGADDPELLDRLADTMYAANADRAKGGDKATRWGAMRASLAGMALVPKETYRARLAVCGDCEHVRKTPVNPLAFEPKATILQCKKCGCIMNAKARMALGACPLKKFT